MGEAAKSSQSTSMAPSVPRSLQLLKSALTRSKPSSSSTEPYPAHSSSNSPGPVTPTQRNLSSFAPFDRTQFVGRLASFKAVFWGQLPEELCELEWARRGWVERRDGKKGIECGLCHASVEVIWDWNRLRKGVLEERRLRVKHRSEGNGVTASGNPENGVEEGDAEVNRAGNEMEEVIQTWSSTNSDEDIFATDAADDDEATALLAKYYTPLLSSGHKLKCPWTTRSTDTTVLRLPPQLLSLLNLQSCLTSLSSIVESFPSQDRIFLPKLLPTTLPPSLSDYDPRAIQASVAGWSGQHLGKQGILTCATCHRRVGLWSFTKDDGETLDLIAEHKQYCPWINAAVQTGMAGWGYAFTLLEPKTILGKRGRDGEGEGEVKDNRIKKLRDKLKSLKK
jgi:hypothetical protein